MDQQGHDGNYFISMTDMMVGVLFVFIIIVSYFVMELQKTVENNDVISRTAHERIVERKVIWQHFPGHFFKQLLVA